MALTHKTPEERKIDISNALSKNLTAETNSNISVVEENKSYTPSDKDLVTDSEEDYKFSRESVKKLIETSNEAIEVMFALASNCENPRAFEVLANMLKSTADMNNQLLVIQKERKKMNTPNTKKTHSDAHPTTTNNTTNIVFSGPTADLQSFLAKRKLAEIKTVDVET